MLADQQGTVGERWTTHRYSWSLEYMSASLMMPYLPYSPMTAFLPALASLRAFFCMRSLQPTSLQLGADVLAFSFFSRFRRFLSRLSSLDSLRSRLRLRLRLSLRSLSFRLRLLLSSSLSLDA